MVKLRWMSAASEERGQVLFLFVGFITVFLLMAAVVIDLGLWLAERRDVQKVADLAAAAGAQELPVDDVAAISAACDIAAQNGRDGTCGTDPADDVYVELWCARVQSVCNASGTDTIRVTVNGQGPILFSSIFGVSASDAAVSSGAAAGLTTDTVVLDTVLMLDASRKMGLCGPGSTACPMRPEAVDAANGFVDLLVSDSNGLSQVGEASFNFCYDPPFNFPVGGQNQCIATATHVIDLTNDADALHDTIDSNIAWGGRNICVGLLQARQMFQNANAQTDPRAKKSLLLLTDGDNNFFYNADPSYPPQPCHPTADASQAGVCSSALPGERDMDTKTYQLAQTLKAAGVSIYVVAIAPCGSDDGNTQDTSGYCGGIGNGANDNTADQRLLKCVASSANKYYRVTQMSDLPSVFRQVAGAILGRRLLQ